MEVRMIRTLPLFALLALVSVGCAAAPKHAAPAGPVALESSPPVVAAAEHAGAPAPAEAPAPESAPPLEPAAPASALPAATDAIHEGAWRIAGGTNAAFTSSDVGPVDQTTFGIEASAGKMISSNVLLEGLFELSTSSTDVDGGGDVDETELLLGAGLRYYFDVEGDTHPYARILGGIDFIDVDFGGGVNDDDAAIFLGFGAGAETFLTQNFALDYGFRFINAFDVFDESLTDIALFIGLSIWL